MELVFFRTTSEAVVAAEAPKRETTYLLHLLQTQEMKPLSSWHPSALNSLLNLRHHFSKLGVRTIAVTFLSFLFVAFLDGIDKGPYKLYV